MCVSSIGSMFTGVVAVWPREDGDELRHHVFIQHLCGNLAPKLNLCGNLTPKLNLFGYNTVIPES